MVLADKFRQRFATPRFSMGKYYLGLGRRQATEPLEQTGLPGMGAKPIKRVDARIDGNGFAKNPHLFSTIDQLAPQGAFSLVTDDHDNGISLLQTVP